MYVTMIKKKKRGGCMGKIERYLKGVEVEWEESDGSLFQLEYI